MKAKRIPVPALLAVVGLVTRPAALTAEDPLPSWNDTAPKKAIVRFVERVTRDGSPDFVPVPERIATFDNDGTLWAEQPVYFQVQFALDRIKALSPKHPEWKTQEPFNHLLAGDMKAFLAGGEKSIMAVIAATHTGMTTEEFGGTVTNWIATAKHPRTGRSYTEMVYQPMLELLAYLRANGFKTFIVSGGGIEFMRPWTEKVYGIPPEQVVGSSGKLKFEVRDGKPVLIKVAEVNLVDDKEGKPVGIQTHIGRRPIAAFGNSDGDLQMLQWTTAGTGPRFALIVHHTDAEREWTYDRTSHIGRLNKAWDEAIAKGWTVVSMKDDWKTVFPQLSSAQTQTITGSVAYRQRMALPPDAVVNVRLEDVSRAGAPSKLIAEVRIPTRGRQVPIPFALAYDPAQVENSHTYHLRALILAGDRTIFTTTRAYPVLTRGAGREAQIMVEQVGGAGAGRPVPAGEVALEGTRWRLVELDGKPAVDAGPASSAGITFVGKDRTIAANTGVNSLGGSYTLNDNRLSIAPGAMTMRAGPEPLMKQEQGFLRALRTVKSYRISGSSLEFLDGEKPVAKFEARQQP